MAVLEKVVWGDETSPQIAPSLSIDKYNLSNDTELWDASISLISYARIIYLVIFEKI